MNVERRFSTLRPTVVAAAASRAGAKSGLTIVGYASVFDQEATIGPYFREVIRPGSFTDAIRRDDVRGLLNHDANRLLGRTSSRTLRLSQDARGLRYEIDINRDDPLAMSVAAQVRRGDINGSSFAFLVDSDDERWEYTKGQTLPLRVVYRVRLIDVSSVVFPAYANTAAGVA